MLLLKLLKYLILTNFAVIKLNSNPILLCIKNLLPYWLAQSFRLVYQRNLTDLLTLPAVGML